MDQIKTVVNMPWLLLLLLFGTQMALAYYIMHGFRNGKETFCPELKKEEQRERERKIK